MAPTDLTELGIPSFGKTMRAMVVEVDGKPVAAAGVIHTDPYYAFNFLTDEMRKHPKEIVRAISAFREFLMEYYEVVYAIADVAEANAPAVLDRVGFKHYLTTTQGEVYVWHKSRYH